MIKRAVSADACDKICNSLLYGTVLNLTCPTADSVFGVAVSCQNNSGFMSARSTAAY
jgi:hypothetical protein